MVYKQRKIGQQIMAVRLIKGEQEKGLSFLDVSTVAKAMEVSDDDIRELIIFYRALDWRGVGNNVDLELEGAEQLRFMIYQRCIKRYAKIFL